MMPAAACCACSFVNFCTISTLGLLTPPLLLNVSLGRSIEAISRPRFKSHESRKRNPLFFFFFQAEDGIRDDLVTGSDVCSSDLCPSCCAQSATSTPVPYCARKPHPKCTT